MSLPGASRYWAEACVGCGLHFDPEFLTDGLCEECLRDQYLWNELAERD